MFRNKTFGLVKRTFIYLTLIMAFIYGKYFRIAGFEADFLEKQSNYTALKKVNEFQYKIFSESKFAGILYVGSAQGYGGPLTVGLQLDSTLNIKEVHILDEKETFGYLQKVIRKGFFKQFKGKSISSDFQVNSGVDAVSTCTVSSLAFAQAIHQAAVEGCKSQNVQYTSFQNDWQLGKNEALTFAVIIFGILAFYFKKKWLRYFSMFSGFVVVGFIVNASISIAGFGRLFLGYLPDPRNHLVWYLLMSFFVGFSLLLAKNVYCSTICPFHALQFALSKLSGLKLKISPVFQKRAKQISGFLLWLSVFTIFISVNPILGSYEPFALLFSLEGVGIQWYLLPAALFGALLVPDYYCHFFCPVGRMHKWLASLNRKAIALIQKTN